MRPAIVVAAVILAAQVLPAASSVSEKDIPPPIEMTGTTRRTDLIPLADGDRILQYNNPDRADDRKGKAAAPTASRIRVFIPGNIKVIKGLWFDLGATYTPDSTAIQAMCRAEGYAFAGCLLRYKYGTELFDLAIKDIAERSGHPELVKCPVITMGFSRNGARAWDFVEETQTRSLALALGGNPGICTNLKLPTRLALAGSIPALTVVGSSDPFVDYGKKNKDGVWHLKHYPEIRAQPGVTWGMMIGWGYGHGWEGSWATFIPFVQEVHALRVSGPAQPDGSVTLRPIAFDQGWFATYGWTGAWPEIAPVAAFTGDKSKAIWLPGPETAHVWRAYQVEKPLAALTVATQGTGTTLGLDAVPPGTTAVAYFDRSHQLGAVATPPFTLAATGIADGVRTVYAVLTINGAQTATRPVTVITGKPINWASATADWKRAEAPESVILITPAQRATLRRFLANEAPIPTAEEMAPIRAAIEALVKDPFIEQRSAAEKLLKKIGAGQAEPPKP